MVPVLQTEFVRGRGNCVAACVASIFNLPLAEVPNFRLAEDQWVALQEWLGGQKLCAIRFPAEADCLWPVPNGVHCILTGNSPRHEGLSHAVVGFIKGREWHLVHDPHPKGGGLKGAPQWVTFFCVACQ